MAQEEWTEEEIRIVKDYFSRELDKIQTADELEDFIKSMNKAKVKQFLKANLQQGADKDRETKDLYEERALEKEALKDKINKL